MLPSMHHWVTPQSSATSRIKKPLSAICARMSVILFQQIMEVILTVSAETATVRLMAMCWKMKEFSFSSPFAKVLRTDDRDYTSYSYLYLPCSSAHLLAPHCFPFCSVSSFFLLAAYLHGIHQQGKRGSFAQGIMRRTDRRFFFPPSASVDIL